MRHWWEEPGQNRKKLPVATPRTERGTPASPGPRLASHALEIGFDSPTIRSLASSRSHEQTSPESDSDSLDRRISARATKLRVGVPLEGEQAFDQARLFWDGLQESSPPAADLSLMALRRSWFQAFLGPPTSAHSHGGFTPMGDIATPSSVSKSRSPSGDRLLRRRLRSTVLTTPIMIRTRPCFRPKRHHWSVRTRPCFRLKHHRPVKMPPQLSARAAQAAKRQAAKRQADLTSPSGFQWQRSF